MERLISQRHRTPVVSIAPPAVSSLALKVIQASASCSSPDASRSNANTELSEQELSAGSFCFLFGNKTTTKSIPKAKGQPVRHLRHTMRKLLFISLRSQLTTRCEKLKTSGRE